MRLYIAAGSPYARIARIVVIEKGLESRVEIIAAQTRTVDSPYCRINPSGRVPYLVRDDGVGMEESAVICSYLDRLDGKPTFDLPGGEEAWEARRLEAAARSLLDGLCVWGREIVRPRDERSPTIIRHEAARAGRMADFWEAEIDQPLMRGALSLGLRRPPLVRRDAASPKMDGARLRFSRSTISIRTAAATPPAFGRPLRPLPAT